METGNPVYITLLNDYYDLPLLKKPQLKSMITAWDNLFDEYLKTFGLSESSEKRLKWKLKIAKMKCEMAINRDWGMNAAIRVEEKKMNAEFDRETKTTIEETTAFVEQYKKTSLDIFKCSVKMFYTYVNLMNKEAKRAKGKAINKSLRNG